MTLVSTAQIWGAVPSPNIPQCWGLWKNLGRKPLMAGKKTKKAMKSHLETQQTWRKRFSSMMRPHLKFFCQKQWAKISVSRYAKPIQRDTSQKTVSAARGDSEGANIYANNKHLLLWLLTYTYAWHCTALPFFIFFKAPPSESLQYDIRE